MLALKTFVLLGSLGLNFALAIVLAGLYFRGNDSATAETDQHVPPPRVTSVTSQPGEAQSLQQSLSNWGETSGEDIIRELRRLGAPLHIRKAVAYALAEEQFRNEVWALRNPLDVPRWRRNRGTPLSPDARARLAELSDLRDQEYKRLLGQDYYAGNSELAERTGLYPNLTSDLLAKVIQIETDYEKIRSSHSRDGKANLLLEQEMLKDLSEILSPEQLADFEAFKSPFAQRLQGRLSFLDINDQEYVNIFAEAAAFQKKFFQRTDTRGEIELSTLYKLEELKHFSGVLQGSELLELATKQDRQFRIVQEIVEKADPSPKRGIRNYESFLTFLNEMDAIHKVSRSQEESYRLGAPAASRAYKSLTEGLNSEHIKEFNDSPFGKHLAKFMSPQDGEK